METKKNKLVISEKEGVNCYGYFQDGIPEERLSDHVYHYDVKDRVFERADKFEERQKEKEAQLGKNEHMGKEQNMKQPKTKKHEMEL